MVFLNDAEIIMNHVITMGWIFYYWYIVEIENKSKSKIIGAFLVGGIYVLFHIVWNETNFGFIECTPLLCLLLFIYFRLLSNHEIKASVVLSIIPSAIITFVNTYLTISLKLILTTETMANSSEDIIFACYVVSFIAKAFLFYFIMNDILHFNSGVIFIGTRSAVMVSTVVLISLYIAEYVSNIQSKYSLYISSSILSFIVLSLFLMKIQVDRTTDKIQQEKARLELDSLQNELSLNKKFLASQEELHILKHDVQHILQTVSQEDNTTLKREIAAKLHTMSSIHIPYDTGNQALDKVLNIKREVAKIEAYLLFVLRILMMTLSSRMMI